MRSSIIPKADIRRIITALGTNASDFGMDGAWLQHRPTRHRFRFTADGRLACVKYYGWISGPVSPEEGSKLSEAFAAWKRNYWCERRSAPIRVRRIGTGRPNTDTRDGLAIVGILALAFLVLMGEDQAIRYFRGTPDAGPAAEPPLIAKQSGWVRQ